MTRQLAMEGAPYGLRANTISPAMIVTGATKPVLEIPGFKENVLRKLMLKRLGQPEDVAWCATFLASDESSWITAADFAVDGGATAW
jgi:NAD(P)-dependent dehydrogenase (short-subunit alcohol dehydrogenase family)